MRITLRQIEAFFWTARLGSMRAAAVRLNFTQPAVSARVRELEEALGVRLFARTNQRVQLTPVGRQAMAYAERLLSAGQEFEQLGQSGSPLEGVLRLGSDEMTAMVALSEILSQLKKHHSRLAVEITIDVGAVLQEKLRRREIDIALHSNADSASHVTDQLIGRVDFLWTAASDFDISAGPFTPRVAAKYPIITNSPPSTLNALVCKWLRSGGIEFEAINSCNSLSLMLRMVRERHAVALLPAPVCREQLASGVLRALTAQPVIPPVPYYASYVTDEMVRGAPLIVDVARDVLTRAQFFVREA